jgi:hypothetical protein
MLIHSNFSRFKSYAWRYLRYIRPRRVCSGLREKVQGVPQEAKQGVYREYGITSYDRGDYEIEVSAQLSWLVGLGVGAQGIFATDPFAAGNPLIVSTIGSPSGDLSDENLPINFGQANPTD